MGSGYHSAEAMLEDVCDFVKALQPYRSDLSSVDYDAFICYKHGPTDSAVAHVLQQKLEHFRVPREKGKKKYPFERIFLDEGELSSCADLGEPIRAVLKNAGWLIVICSPDTPLSPWVRSEIDVFMEYHDRSRILAVLTGGEPEEAFPEQLLGGDKAGEVLAADARGRDVHEVLQKTKRDVILRIAAPMLGLPYDSLRQRRKIYAMKRFAVLTALALALVSAFSVYAVVQNVRIDEQYNAVRIRESRYLSEVAERALEEGDRTKAINIALLALPSAAQDRPYVPDAERVLTDALHAYEYDPDTTSHDYDMKLSMNDNITDMIICEDTYLCCVTEAHWIGVFNTTDGTCLWQRRLQEIVDDPSIDNDYAYDAIEDITYDTGTGNLIMTFRGHIICIDLKSGASVWTRELCDYGDIAYCLQGDLLYAFPYGKMISNNLIYCYSIADGVDKGVYPMNTSSIVTDGSEGACFVYAEIHVDEEHNAVIAATLHDEESTSKDDSEHCVVCAYNFQNMTTSILERTDDMLGFLPVGEDYYLASADYSSAERDRFKTNYNLLRITRITYDGIKLSFVWERQHKMSYPLAAWGYLHNGDSIHMWDGSDYIALGIGKDIISIAPEDGRKLDQYSGSSEIVSVQKSVRPIILNENGEIQEYVSYGNIWTRDHLNRVALKLVAGADYYAVLFQDQPQATYILRNLNDNWYSAVFHSSSMFAFSQEYLGSSDGSSILYISDPLGERRIGTLGRLIDMQTMDMVESWFFEGAQRKDILQLSADGNNVFWLCKECLESNIDYAFYTEVYEKWMQSIEAVSDWPIVNESKIIHISSNDSTEITVSAPAEKKAADETTTESIKADFFLVEQEDGSVLATWIDETPSREPYALTSYYGIFDWFSDEPQFHYSIADNLSGNEYRIEDLLPDTQYTIFLRMANGDAMGEYIRTRATPDYSKGDISFQRAMLQGGEGQDMQCADSWLLEDVQRQLASGDLHLVCSFDTTAACPAGEKKLLIRVTAPNGSVGEKGLSIDLQSDMRNQQIVMDFNIDVLLNMIDEKVAHIPTGAYIVDLYVDRQYLGSASFSINFSDM